jgi:hypothetical protein
MIDAAACVCTLVVGSNDAIRNATYCDERTNSRNLSSGTIVVTCSSSDSEVYRQNQLPYRRRMIDGQVVNLL